MPLPFKNDTNCPSRVSGNTQAPKIGMNSHLDSWHTLELDIVWYNRVCTFHHDFTVVTILSNDGRKVSGSVMKI
ncbi:hypothetical protein Mapa_015649 [Marchantia paleacea]|nr:hypothetical protein Mapa_015649 [Marchantia paleacea]